MKRPVISKICMGWKSRLKVPEFEAPDNDLAHYTG